MIWSALFMVGNFLYGRMGYATALAGVFVVSAAVVMRVVNRTVEVAQSTDVFCDQTASSKCCSRNANMYL